MFELRNFVFSGLLGISCLSAYPSVASAQSVVIDGTTATTVSTGAGGVVTVDIAPANASSTSINKYTDFSVNLPGVNLDNTAVGAGTIVNEVTSNRISNINGPLSVLGPQADVILANPNGITVNGGSFNNTGNVGLATGTISLDGLGRVTSQIRGGKITIGPQGLAGAIEELDLIAKIIQVNGNIAGNTSQSIAKLNLIAGDSDVVFDPNRAFPDILPWASISEVGGTNSGAVSVDITRPSSIASGAIRIAVTDAGAGVRMAGAVAASINGFRLTADGKVEINGTEITAKKAIDIIAGEVSFSSDTRQTSILSQESGVVIETTSGGIDLGDSEVEGQIISSSNLASAGGVTLISSGGITHSGEGSNFEARLISTVDGIALSAAGDLSLNKTTATSGKDFVATTSGGIEIIQTAIDADDSIRFLAIDDFAASSSQLNAADNITVTAASARFDVDANAIENTRTELIASTGGIFVETTVGDFVNQGSLLQGGDTVNGEPRADGALTVISAGGILNESLDVDHLAVLFGNQDALSLSATGSIINRNGRFLTNSDLRIISAHDLINETTFTGNTQALVVSSTSGSRLAETLWLRRGRSNSVTGDFGDQFIENELALILAIGDATISAQNISNLAGDISGSNVSLNVDQGFANEARLSGSVIFKQSCRIFCSSSGNSNVRSVGGSVTASSDLNIAAGTEITSQAGRLVGANGATFVAPVIRSTQLQIPLFVERPSGLTGFFRGRRAWLASTFEGTQFSAFGGDLTLNGDVDLEGALLFAIGEQIITGSQNIVATPTDANAFGREDLGFLWGLF